MVWQYITKIKPGLGPYLPVSYIQATSFQIKNH